MGGLRINFGEVEGSFEPLPEGRYECIVERVEVRESNSSDNDYLNWELKVVEDEFKDRRLWMITSLSERALFRLKDSFVALDVMDEDDEIDIEWDDDVDITPKEGPLMTNPEVAGLPCVAIVTNEIYDGRERNRVNEIVGTGGRRRKAAAKSNGKGKPAQSASKAKAKASGSRRKLR